MTQPKSTRRKFLQDGTKIAAVTAGAGVVSSSGLSLARSANAGGSETIKIGLVGCGGRGTSAAHQAMNTEGNVELVAMGDAFANRLEQSAEGCVEKHPDKTKVTDDKKFVGYDAYKRVLDSGVDMVLLTTPPGFRPLHFEAAIDAGIHVFMEKPVAVDAPGIRRVLKANEKAKANNLAVAVGLQRRHEAAYKETINELKNGIIGELVASRVYWNGAGVWKFTRQPKQTELEYQMRNWYYFNWICGDHIVEQHIHNLDVINWLMDDFPISASGQGGRMVRTGPDTGQIYDHHMVEYTYANGHKMISQCRHMPNCENNVSEHVHGTKGSANISRARIFDTDGKKIFQSKGKRGGWQQEHHDLFADIRRGIIPNEGDYGAKSTLTAIIGRLATYTGKPIKWDAAMNSNVTLCDVDRLKSMEDRPPLSPDEYGNYWIPMPGQELEKTIDF
ncbi:MAG: Gfo/Idh/MocA family oxidoreductase [Planctomycetota bacterium]